MTYLNAELSTHRKHLLNWLGWEELVLTWEIPDIALLFLVTYNVLQLLFQVVNLECQVNVFWNWSLPVANSRV